MNPKDLCGAKKVPFSVLSPRVLSVMALGMLEGALKYGRFNWRQRKVLASIYFDGTMRHLLAWYEGEDIDPETIDPETGIGTHHIAKAMTSLHVLMDAILMDTWVDDRPPRGENVNFMDACNKAVVALSKRFPNPVPPCTHLPL